ncbi:MAG TPA: hypothetical protein VLI92_00760 [Candidatus Saccharimonadales bacterium]|nr:hypothetical protein [Candidatus Saccharimonadales bacterium]
MKSTSYYIKIATLAGLLLLLSFLLSETAINVIYTANYLNPPIETFIEVGLLMLALCYTYALTLGAWHKWVQYAIVAVPMSIGVFLVVSSFDLYYGSIITFVLFLLFVYEIYESTLLIDLLVKARPSAVLKISAQGFLFFFSILAAVLLFMATTFGTSKIDLPAKLSQQINSLISGQVMDAIKQNLGANSIGVAEQAGINPQKIVSDKINEYIENYKPFVLPLMMLLVFGIFQFLGGITLFIFGLTVNPIFGILKKVGFFKVEQVQITKEYLRF